MFVGIIILAATAAATARQLSVKLYIKQSQQTRGVVDTRDVTMWFTLCDFCIQRSTIVSYRILKKTFTTREQCECSYILEESDIRRFWQWRILPLEKKHWCRCMRLRPFRMSYQVLKSSCKWSGAVTCRFSLVVATRRRQATSYDDDEDKINEGYY